MRGITTVEKDEVVDTEKIAVFSSAKRAIRDAAFDNGRDAEYQDYQIDEGCGCCFKSVFHYKYEGK